MASEYGHAAYAKDMFDDLRSGLQESPPSPPQLQVVIVWIVSIFTSLLQTLEMVFARIDRESKAPSKSSTSSGPSKAPRVSGRKPRCTKCHARGHSVNECHTLNPSAMRKRVATNSATARSARTSHAMSTVSGYPPLLPYPGIPFYPPSPSPMKLAALAADSTELHRRAAQSARDKRRRSANPKS